MLLVRPIRTAVLTASAYQPLVQCQPSITEVFEQVFHISVMKWEAVASCGIWMILPQ